MNILSHWKLTTNSENSILWSFSDSEKLKAQEQQMTFLCLQRVGVKKELGEGGPSCPLHDWKAILSTLCEIPCLETPCMIYRRTAEPMKPAQGWSRSRI